MSYDNTRTLQCLFFPPQTVGSSFLALRLLHLSMDNTFFSSTSSKSIIANSQQQQPVIPRMYSCCRKINDNSEQILHIPTTLPSKDDFPRVFSSLLRKLQTLIILAGGVDRRNKWSHVTKLHGHQFLCTDKAAKEHYLLFSAIAITSYTKIDSHSLINATSSGSSLIILCDVRLLVDVD